MSNVWSGIVRLLWIHYSRETTTAFAQWTSTSDHHLCPRSLGNYVRWHHHTITYSLSRRMSSQAKVANLVQLDIATDLRSAIFELLLMHFLLPLFWSCWLGLHFVLPASHTCPGLRSIPWCTNIHPVQPTQCERNCTSMYEDVTKDLPSCTLFSYLAKSGPCLAVSRPTITTKYKVDRHVQRCPRKCKSQHGLIRSMRFDWQMTCSSKWQTWARETQASHLKLCYCRYISTSRYSFEYRLIQASELYSVMLYIALSTVSSISFAMKSSNVQMSS